MVELCSNYLSHNIIVFRVTLLEVVFFLMFVFAFIESQRDFTLRSTNLSFYYAIRKPFLYLRLRYQVHIVFWTQLPLTSVNFLVHLVLYQLLTFLLLSVQHDQDQLSQRARATRHGQEAAHGAVGRRRMGNLHQVKLNFCNFIAPNCSFFIRWNLIATPGAGET
jgi:hypothetical protein